MTTRLSQLVKCLSHWNHLSAGHFGCDNYDGWGNFSARHLVVTGILSSSIYQKHGCDNKAVTVGVMSLPLQYNGWGNLPAENLVVTIMVVMVISTRNMV